MQFHDTFISGMLMLASDDPVRVKFFSEESQESDLSKIHTRANHETMFNGKDMMEEASEGEKKLLLPSRMGFPRLDQNSSLSLEPIREETLEQAKVKAYEIYVLLRRYVQESHVGLLSMKFSRYASTPTISKDSRIALFSSIRQYLGDNEAAYTRIIDVLLAKDVSNSELAQILFGVSSENSLFYLKLLHFIRMLCNYDLPMPLFPRMQGRPPCHRGSMEYVYERYTQSNQYNEYIKNYMDKDTKDIHETLIQSIDPSSMCMIYAILKSTLDRVRTDRRFNVNELLTEILAGLNARDAYIVMPHLARYFSGGSMDFDFKDRLHSEARYRERRDRIENTMHSILELRMRTSHIMISDLREGMMKSSQLHFEDSKKEAQVATMIWNIVTLLDKPLYHRFYTRFFRFKAHLRPSVLTCEYFLRDIEKAVGPQVAPLLFPSFRQCFESITVKSLMACKLKVESSGSRLRMKAAVDMDSNPEDGIVLTNTSGKSQLFYPSRCVIYNNLPTDCTDSVLHAALSKVGSIRSLQYFHNLAGEISVSRLSTKKQHKKMTAKAIKDNKTNSTVSPRCCVVEFDTDAGLENALNPAVKIFGVISKSTTEMRPLYAHELKDFTKLVFHGLQFGSICDDFIASMRERLPAGVNFHVERPFPVNARVSDGFLEFYFSSHIDMLIVFNVMHEWLDSMQPTLSAANITDKEGKSDSSQIKPVEPSSEPKDPPIQVTIEFPRNKL